MTTVPAEPAERTEESPRRAPRWRVRLGSIEMLAAVVLLAVLLRGSLVDLFSSPRASTFVTIFASVMVAGLPLLVLSSFASAAIAAFVPRRHLDRLLTVPPEAAVPAAAGAGLIAPLGDDGPEVAARLLRSPEPVGPRARGRRRELAPAVAVTFLLASAAINPVVLIGTAVAFPAEPMMVLARLLAGLLAAAGMGSLWLWLGRPEWFAVPGLGAAGASGPGATGAVAGSGGGWPVFWERCRLDIVRAGGFLVLGAFAAAVITAWLPARWLDAIGGSGPLAVVLLALLAVLLSVRGGVDAFVAAAVSQFPATARLAFLVVGPIANLRLFTQQLAIFGQRFAVRFAPAALGVGVACAVIVGTVLL